MHDLNPSEDPLARRQIGTNGPVVSAIGLGCMGMSEFYGAADEKQAIATLHRALELGVTLFDTADMYGDGENERLLARALRGRRDEAILATKFGIRRDGSRRWCDNSADYVRASVEESLRRLETDRIDLYYVHRRNEETPIEETMGALSELVAEGKIGSCRPQRGIRFYAARSTCRAPGRRIAKRVFALDPRARAGDPAGCSRAWRRPGRLQPAGAGDAHRPHDGGRPPGGR